MGMYRQSTMNILARNPNIAGSPFRRARQAALARKQWRIKNGGKAKAKSKAHIRAILEGTNSFRAIKDGFVGQGKQITKLFHITDGLDDRLDVIEDASTEVADVAKGLMGRFMNPIQRGLRHVAYIAQMELKVKPVGTQTLASRLFSQEPNAQFVTAPVGTNPVNMYAFDPSITTESKNAITKTTVFDEHLVLFVQQWDGTAANDNPLIGAIEVTADGDDDFETLCSSKGLTITTAKSYCTVTAYNFGSVQANVDLGGGATVGVIDELIQNSKLADGLKAAGPAAAAFAASYLGGGPVSG